MWKPQTTYEHTEESMLKFLINIPEFYRLWFWTLGKNEKIESAQMYFNREVSGCSVICCEHMQYIRETEGIQRVIR